MSDSRMRYAVASLFCLVVFLLGCNRAPDQPRISPTNGAKQDPASGSEPVEGHSFSLEPILGSEGNVHVYFLQRQPLAEERPFFVVWTDARGYSGARGYPSAQNVPARKNVVEGDLTLRYGGKGNDYDREVKCSFEITIGEKGQFRIDGKTYEFAKGTVFLISGKNDDLRVKQMSRDLSKLPVGRDDVVALAKADPDIKEFVSKMAKAK